MDIIMSKVYDELIKLKLYLKIIVVAIIIFFIVLLVGYFTNFWNFTKVYGYIISFVVGVVSSEITNVLDKKAKEAVISITPLNLIRGRYPDSPAQFISMVRSSNVQFKNNNVINPGESKSLTARFGVLKVKVVKGEILNCVAEVNYKPSFFQPNGDKIDSKYRNAGRLNWYSVSKFDNIMNSPDFQPYRLNTYLLNPVINLHEGEEKELLVCYVIDSISTNTVNLCTESESAGAAQFNKEGKANFQVEIYIVGNGYSKKSWYFDITIDKTSIIITPIESYK